MDACSDQFDEWQKRVREPFLPRASRSSGTPETLERPGLLCIRSRCGGALGMSTGSLWTTVRNSKVAKTFCLLLRTSSSKYVILGFEGTVHQSPAVENCPPFPPMLHASGIKNTRACQDAGASWISDAGHRTFQVLPPQRRAGIQSLHREM